MSIKAYVTGVQHVGIPTNRYVESVHFYEQLGFELVNTELQPNGGRVAFLQLANLVMEIYEADQPKMEAGSIDHIAMDTKNIEEIYKVVEQLGLKDVSDGVQTLPFWNNGIKYLIIEGPNRERLEFCQIL